MVATYGGSHGTWGGLWGWWGCPSEDCSDGACAVGGCCVGGCLGGCPFAGVCCCGGSGLLLGSPGGCIAHVCTISAAMHVPVRVCGGGMLLCAVAASVLLCLLSERLASGGYKLVSFVHP